MKLRTHRLSRLAGFVPAGLAAALAVTGAGADTIVQEGSLEGYEGLHVYDIALERFNTLGGSRQLNWVQIEAQTSLIGGGTTTGEGGPVSIYVELSADYDLDGDLLVSTEAIIDAVIPNTFPNQSFTLFDSDSDEMLVDDPAALEDWVGSGEIVMTATVGFTVDMTPPDVLEFSAGGSVTYTITYDYDEIPSTPPTYSVTLIDLFEGDFANTATGINNQGQVVGYSNAPGGNHSWRWANGVLEDIGAIGGVVMRAQDINEQGHVAGYGNDGDLDWVGWTWNGSELVTVPTFGGPGSRLWAINDLGQAVGDAQLPDGVWNALLWDGGVATNLGTLGGANSQAYEMNDSGQVVGFATRPDISARAVIWHDGGITELEHPEAYPDSVAYDINDSGLAVGTAHVGQAEVVPAMWQDTALTLLPPIPGEQTVSFAWAVNEPGQIVGWSKPSFFETVPTTWIEGQVYDLNDLIEPGSGVEMTQAWDINDEGVIVGVGFHEDTLRAMVLTPMTLDPADLNGDGTVDGADLGLLLGNWGPCDGCPADLNGDGTVDGADLGILLGAWG
jgi:probable HAF family extracellular repeat protein